MAKRKRLPTAVEIGIKILSGSKCCVCGVHQFQIHHIDGNHDNNNPTNLAALCLPHHDEAEQGKSTDGNRLSVKLTDATIRAAKEYVEDSNAKRMGFSDADAFWTHALGKKVTKSSRRPALLGIAFQDWKTWELYKEKVAAYSAEFGRPYFSRVGQLGGKLFVMVCAGIPGQDLKPPTNWEQDGALYRIPLERDSFKGLAFTSFSSLPPDKQARACAVISSQLENREAFERFGILAEVQLNGQQPWPSGRVDLQLGVWLQHVAILRHYFELLGDRADDFRKIAIESPYCRGSNLSPDRWGFSVCDAYIAERAKLIATVVSGKAEELSTLLGGVFKAAFNMELPLVVQKLVTPGPMNETPWDRLIDAISTAIAASTSPENLSQSLNYPNPLLQHISVTSYKDGVFNGRTKVNTAILTNTRTSHVQPADNEGRCNLRLNYSNECRIAIYPNKSVIFEEFEKEIFESGLEGIFAAFRKGNPGSLKLADPG